ncbi:hypothetical protein BOX15_Mlig032718g2, partial [Macrostomum lignano]
HSYQGYDQQPVQYGQLPRDLPFRCSLVSSVVGSILYLVAFVTPYWIESDPAMKSTFTRLGLWVSCFNNYIHPEDYVSKAYSGCWYIYYPEYYYIRSWLNPPWFYAVQMMGIVALICMLLATLIISRLACRRFINKQVLREPADWKLLRVCAICQSLATFCVLLQLILVGVKSLDREWMPKPDHNRLGFSYGLACVANFASLFTVAFIVIRYLDQDELDYLLADQEDKGLSGLPGPSTVAKGPGSYYDPTSGDYKASTARSGGPFGDSTV